MKSAMEKRGDGLDSFAGLTPAMQLPLMFFVTQNLSEETEEEVPVCRRHVGSSWWPCNFCQLLRVFERAGFPCIFKKVKPWLNFSPTFPRQEALAAQGQLAEHHRSSLQCPKPLGAAAPHIRFLDRYLHGMGCDGGYGPGMARTLPWSQSVHMKM